MAKQKKAKQIKAEAYEENVELDNNLDIEDDTYEEDYDIDAVVDDDYDLEDDEEDEIEIDEVSKYETSTNVEIENFTEDEEYEDAKKTFNRAKTEKIIKIFNVLFVIVIIVMILIAVDVVCVARYDVGPFFAIKTNTYKDGGTKVYYGLGYKVIKYNQIEGRRDTQIGFWNMPYSITPTEIEDIDLAIEFQNNPEKTSEKYYKQYLKISSKIKKIDKEDNKMILEYTDPDGKYTLQIDCPMASDKEKLNEFAEQQEVKVKGTVYKFAFQDDKQSNKVYLSDCFAE